MAMEDKTEGNYDIEGQTNCTVYPTLKHDTNSNHKDSIMSLCPEYVIDVDAIASERANSKLDKANHKETGAALAAAADEEIDVDNFLDHIEPLPTSGSSLGGARTVVRVSLPGAYATDTRPFGTGHHFDVLPLDSATVSSSDETTAGTDDAGLATALPVTVPMADEAQPVDDSALEGSRRRKQTSTSTAIFVCCCIVALLVAACSLLTILKQGGATSRHTREPSTDKAAGVETGSNVTGTQLSPLAKQLSLLLPPSTLANIEQDISGSTPQYRALEWVQRDPWIGNYSNDRLIQRFALATLYFATNGNTSWIHRGGDTLTLEFHPNTAEDQIFLHSVPREPKKRPSNSSNGRQPPPPPHKHPPPPHELRNMTSEKWLSYEMDECQWFSLTFLEAAGRPCSTKDTFVHLNLRQNGLAGSLPAELGLLTGLQTMAFWRNELNGTIPTQIGQLTNLQQIGLAEGSLTGTIPSEIGSLASSLVLLKLIRNKLSGTVPTQLWNMPALQALMIGRNELIGTLPADIGHTLPNAKLLMVARNRFSGTLPTSLGLLTGLINFDGPENDFTGSIPTELGKATSLTLLQLQDNLLSGRVPSQLGLLSDLMLLSLDGNSELTGKLPQELSALNESLKELHLKGTSITGTIPPGFCGMAVLSFDCSKSLCGCGCPC